MAVCEWSKYTEGVSASRVNGSGLSIQLYYNQGDQLSRLTAVSMCGKVFWRVPLVVKYFQSEHR